MQKYVDLNYNSLNIKFLNAKVDVDSKQFYQEALASRWNDEDSAVVSSVLNIGQVRSDTLKRVLLSFNFRMIVSILSLCLYLRI